MGSPTPLEQPSWRSVRRLGITFTGASFVKGSEMAYEHVIGCKRVWADGRAIDPDCLWLCIDKPVNMQTICKEQLGLKKHFHRQNGDIIKIVLPDSKSMLFVLLTERSFLLFIALQLIRISYFVFHHLRWLLLKPITIMLNEICC